MSELPVTLVFTIVQKSGKLLETLTLRECKWLNDEMLLKLTMSCPKIQSLEIPGCIALTAPGIIAALQHSPARTLNISECVLTSAQLKTIAETTSLQTLIANQCRWTDTSFKRIKEIPNLQKLVLIPINNIGPSCDYRKIFPNLTDIELCLPISSETLKELHRWKDLKRFWIKPSFQRIRPLDIKSLGQCSHLEAVSVSNPQHVDVIFHPKMKHFQLSYLELDRTESNGFLQMANLVTLVLRIVSIDLLPIFQMKSLKNLTLYNCNVVSESLSSSSIISRLTFLRIILDSSVFGDGYRPGFNHHLEPMAKHTSHLTSLHLECRGCSNQVTIPHCYIDAFLESNPIVDLMLDDLSYFKRIKRRPMTLTLAARYNPDPRIFSLIERKRDHLPYGYSLPLWRGILEVDKS
eukprot:TRINITY_DN5188_c0_g1_i1.p1 TRINITY_DN5188_c0_g1~~TRINITY_DN5188_c0_g1_i1.p1  ORF type:complete len:407 (-),score=65.07 TRINITY_DN5188_c0_g1_i1:5-1225(-)